jgi:hypothetical protein
MVFHTRFAAPPRSLLGRLPFLLFLSGMPTAYSRATPACMRSRGLAVWFPQNIFCMLCRHTFFSHVLTGMHPCNIFFVCLASMRFLVCCLACIAKTFPCVPSHQACILSTFFAAVLHALPRVLLSLHRQKHFLRMRLPPVCHQACVHMHAIFLQLCLHAFPRILLSLHHRTFL